MGRLTRAAETSVRPSHVVAPPQLRKGGIKHASAVRRVTFLRAELAVDKRKGKCEQLEHLMKMTLQTQMRFSGFRIFPIEFNHLNLNLLLWLRKELGVSSYSKSLCWGIPGALASITFSFCWGWPRITTNMKWMWSFLRLLIAARGGGKVATLYNLSLHVYRQLEQRGSLNVWACVAKGGDTWVTN